MTIPPLAKDNSAVRMSNQPSAERGSSLISSSSVPIWESEKLMPGISHFVYVRSLASEGAGSLSSKQLQHRRQEGGRKEERARRVSGWQETIRTYLLGSLAGIIVMAGVLHLTAEDKGVGLAPPLEVVTAEISH